MRRINKKYSKWIMSIFTFVIMFLYATMIIFNFSKVDQNIIKTNRDITNNVHAISKTYEVKISGGDYINQILTDKNNDNKKINIYEIGGEKYYDIVESVILDSVVYESRFEEKDVTFDHGENKSETLYASEVGFEIPMNSNGSGAKTFYPKDKNNSNCYIKPNISKIWCDSEGFVHVEEKDRNTDNKGTSEIDSHQKFGSIQYDLKGVIESSTYKFTINYKDDLYDLAKDDFESKVYIDKTNSNNAPGNFKIYTSKNTYYELEQNLRTSIQSEYIQSSVDSPLTEDIGMEFFYKTEHGYEPIINETNQSTKSIYLNSDRIYVRFYDANESNPFIQDSRGDNTEDLEALIQSEVIEYGIPYVDDFIVYDAIDSDEDIPERNSFGNESSFYVSGDVKHNNLEIYLNTGAEIKVDMPGKSDEWTNIINVELFDSAGNLKNDSGSTDGEYFKIVIKELGEFKLKLSFDNEVCGKKDNNSLGDEKNEIIIKIHSKDGNVFFDNNDLKDGLGNSIDHSYGIYENELYEYYKSDDIFKFNNDSTNSNFLIKDNFLKKEVNYIGELKEAKFESNGNVTWVDSSSDLIYDANTKEVQIGVEGKSKLYKYTLEDVFGYKYDYYFESNTYEEGVVTSYFDTDEGKELLSYEMFNNPSVIKNLSDIQNNYNFKEVEDSRADLIGKRNLKYYELSNKFIKSEVGKVEYGTDFLEIKKDVEEAIIKDLTNQKYDLNTYTLTCKTSDDEQVIDSTVIKYNILGIMNSSTYGEINISVKMDLVRNLTKLVIDEYSLENVTYYKEEDLSFSKNIAPSLNDELYEQFSNKTNSYFNIDEDVDFDKDGVHDINIIWTIPSYENDELRYGDKIKYEIISTNEDYYIGEIHGEITSRTRYSLEDMYMNNALISKETILFEDGTLFSEIQPHLENAIKNQLNLKFINISKLDIIWYINGEETNEESILKTGDIISYNIFPGKDSERFKDVKTGEFISQQYISISSILINLEELQEYINKKYVGTEFSIIKPELERMIRKQISDQIGNEYSAYIDIEWMTGDEELLEYGKNIEFKLVSNSPIKVHNSNNLYKIQFEEVESPKKLSFVDTLYVLMILILAGFILIGTYIFFQ